MQRNADVFDSFINANYINTSTSQNDQVFIATQGPLPTTRENFWRMLEQEHVDLVIMLCSVRENGKVKCDQYWPLEVSETLVFEEFKVTLTSVE